MLTKEQEKRFGAEPQVTVVKKYRVPIENLKMVIDFLVESGLKMTDAIADDIREWSNKDGTRVVLLADVDEHYPFVDPKFWHQQGDPAYLLVGGEWFTVTFKAWE